MLQGVVVHDGRRAGRADRPQRHGQVDAVRRDRRAARPRDRVRPARRQGAARPARVQDRRGRDRLRAPGPAAVPVADRRRAPADRRREVEPAWTPKRVYELFPRLAERKNVSGTSLSGGEQQMLAIGRALLTNPKLLVMDEPSEGLAPTIVEGLVQTIKDLAAEGMGLLVVEQNLGVATSLAERQLVMVTGQIATETTAQELDLRPRRAAPLPRRRAAGRRRLSGGAGKPLVSRSAARRSRPPAARTRRARRLRRGPRSRACRRAPCAGSRAGPAAR